jgi:hypothetical protein
MLANAVDRLFKDAIRKRDKEEQAAVIAEVRETVIVYDYDPNIKGGTIWQATLPLSELFEHVGASCRYTYDTEKTRPIGAAIGAVGATVLVGLLFLILLPIAMAAILGLMFGGPLGAMAGWTMAPKYAPKPIWLVRRVWAQIPPDDALPVPTTGYDGHNTYLDEKWERTVVPLPHTYLQGPEVWPHLINVPTEATAQSGHLIGMDVTDDTQAYEPVVHRATTLFRMLQQQVTKRRLSRKNMSGWQKVQIGSCAALALGVLGLLLFVLLVTEDPPGATAATAHLLS